MGHAALAKARERYAWHAVSNHIAEIYQQIEATFAAQLSQLGA